MEYQEFLEEVRKGIEQSLKNGCSAAIHKVLKNNAVCMHGLVVMEKGESISPTIYLEPFYEKLKEGDDFEQILKEILLVYEESRLKEHVDISFFTDYEKIRERLFHKLINYEANKELLKLVPHRRFLDLAVVPYCLINNQAVGSASILVHHTHMNMWGIDETELMQEAERNTRETLGYEIVALRELLEEMMPEEEDKEIPGEEIKMYVLSNLTKLHGAVCMTYEDVLVKFAEQLNSDLYILPSSIHEVLLVPAADNYRADRLTEMVREVNSTQVETEDMLSNHAYLFKKEGGFTELLEA